MSAEPMPWKHIRLNVGPDASGISGPSAALYVMVTATGRAAKVGALYYVRRAEPRLGEVDRDQRHRDPTPDNYPMALAVVAELEGLVLGTEGTHEWDERWATVEHMEASLRLVLARRLGRVSRWVDWVELDVPQSNDQWAQHVALAWEEVEQLGRAART